MSELHASDHLCSQVWDLIPSDEVHKFESHEILMQLHGSNLSEQWTASDSCGVLVDADMIGFSPTRKVSASTSPSISREFMAPNDTSEHIARDEDCKNENIQSVSQKRSLKIMVSDHETHIWTERERRKKMRTMFATLHSLLPHLAPKTDKSTIVDEAISYIKSLQQSLQVLQNQRLEKARAASSLEYRSFELQDCIEPIHDTVVVDNWQRTVQNPIPSPMDHTLQTWSSPNVVVSVCGEEAQIGICTARRPGQLAAIFYTLEKHSVDVVTAQISGDCYRCMYMIHGRAATPAATEAFKLVIGDLVLYLSSL